MNNLTRKIVVLTVFLMITGTSTAGGPDDNGYISSADMLAPFLCEFNDPPNCVVVGASTIFRTAAGIGLNVTVSGMAPDTPHTIWMAVFNNPAACDGFPSGPCGLADLGNPDVQATLVWAAGNYTDGNGDGFFQAFIEDGPTDREQPLPLPGNPDGLVNPNRAEVHFIVRSHPIVAGEEYEAINSLNGSCPEGVGCADHASSIHKR